MPSEELAQLVRRVRRAYDALPRGDRAVLRRCRSARDVMLEGTFWRLVDDVPAELQPRFAPVVACFPSARALARAGAGLSLGAHLRRRLYQGRSLGPAATIRFR